MPLSDGERWRFQNQWTHLRNSRHSTTLLRMTDNNESGPTRRRWATINQFAAEWEISEKTVRRMIADGEIYAERIGPRLIRVDPDSLKGVPIAPITGSPQPSTDAQ